MPTIYVSPNAGFALITALGQLGHDVCLTVPAATLHPAIAAHPDMLMCKLGACRGSPIYFMDTAQLAPQYPSDARCNALCLEGYFVHRLDISDKKLLSLAVSRGLKPVNVRQGYTKCSSVVVDGNSIITADPGVASAVGALPGTEVLRIRPGYVELKGFNTGFIGGASGRIGNDIWFNGDITAHPDWRAISQFILCRGLGIRRFDYQLEDIGSLIEGEPLKILSHRPGAPYFPD